MYRSQEVKNYVANRIYYMKNMKDLGDQKALYAELRRGIGRRPGEIPQLWGILFRDLPEKMMSRNGEPSREEWAISTVLTLYAYHQQGKDPSQNSMNVENQGLGQAMIKLKESDDDEERILRRFNRFATSSDMEEAATHLRGIVGLLKSKDIGLDYPRLAGELYEYQSYDGAKRVRLTWGEDFYRHWNTKKEKESHE